MRLLPLEDEPDLVPTVAAWMRREDVAPLIAFRVGDRELTPRILKILVQRDMHDLRVYTDDDEERPIGVVGLSDIDRQFETGTLWFALGDRDHARRGYTTRAARRMLDAGFEELGLHAIQAWAVSHNVSRKILRRLGFRRIGVQRQCHRIDGEPRDRVLYDLLAEEHRQRGQDHAA